MYLIGIRYGVVPLIILRKKFRFERLKRLLNYPLFIFNSKNVEKEKKRYRKLVKKLFDGLKQNLKKLRSIIEDVIKRDALFPLNRDDFGVRFRGREGYLVSEADNSC